MIRSTKTCGVLAATVLATGAMLLAAPSAAYAAALTPNSVAQFAGTATFEDGCDSGYVCFHAVSDTCFNTQSVLNVSITLSGCKAELTDASYRKVSSNGQEFCAGTGSGTFTFTDYNGRVLPSMTVTVVASEGTIHITGSSNDIAGTKTQSVDATIASACGSSAPWSGSLSMYNV